MTRILVGLAAALIATSLAIGIAPVHTELLVYNPGAPGDCGSLFLPGDDAGDDGCEERLLSRFGLVVLPALGGVILGGVGVALMWRSVRPSE
jgi:hypothetical protein